MYLPLANLMHYKLRSFLSALGIGIGICMLVTLSGLSRGSLYEVADRWESVDADLFAYPSIWGQNITALSGVGLPDRYGDIMLDKHSELIERIVPVFLWSVQLAGQNQLTAGVDPEHWNTLLGGRKLLEGRLFDPDNRFGRWLEDRLLKAPELNDTDQPTEITQADLLDPDHNGMEIVIDSRLAKAGRLQVDQEVDIVNHRFRIVGIVESGGMSRVYMPRKTAQFLFGSGDITKSTLLFIKLRPLVDPNLTARKLMNFGVQVVQTSQFRKMLEHQFGIMFVYVDAVNTVALGIAFLFIMLSLYMMVLQHTRDIAILKSSGASDWFIIRAVLGESILLTGAGTVMGLILGVAAGWVIEATWTLLTVNITWDWIVVAIIAAIIGAVLSSIYPAWQATKVDMIEALSWE